MGQMTTKDLLVEQTHLAYAGDPEMSLKASLAGVTDAIASRTLVDQSWTIEEIVYHLASCKIEYCRQGFGRWTDTCEKPAGSFARMIDLLDRAQTHLSECLESCSEADLARPIPTQFHGESAARFFTIMIMHDVAHAAQIRTRLRVFGVRSDGYYPV
jgi:hypothetical protein